MKQFIFKVFLFCIVFFIVEKLFYVFLYVSPMLEVDTRLQMVLDGKINKEIIVLGSSRGSRNIIASQIEDSMNISAYNLSYPGSNIEFHEFILKTLIRHNEKPKIILLALDDPSELLPDESITFRLDRLYPLVRYNYINNELILRKEKSFLSKILILSRLNNSNLDVRKKTFSKFDTIMACGSMPISFQKRNCNFVFSENNNSYSPHAELPEKIQAFINLQKLCVDNRIKLYVIYSPNFKNHNLLFQKRINELLFKEFSSIIYDTTNIAFKDKSYFYDESHLKLNGASIFTNEIISILKGK